MAITKILHKKSAVSGKKPTSGQLDYGEIAINYAKGSEMISIKNNSDEIVTFTAGGNSPFTLTSNGGAQMSDCTSTGQYAVAEGSGTTASGNYSHTEGYNTKASGISSHAEGYNTKASGNNSHAEGIGTTASGLSSHAEGGNTTANGQGSHAEGSVTTADGDFSHAEGQGTTASGAYSHTEGQSTLASGECSHAEGYNTRASGEDSHAEGNNTKANGSFSHAEGWQTTASGNSSHAEGRFTKADSMYSHAEGYMTTASGWQSHSEGSGTTASGEDSHAEGSGTIASGSSSHAEGIYSTAGGNYSHAEGYDTTASSESSHAEGSGAVASGEYSHAEGNQAEARGISSHAEGDSTVARGYASHTEGNGTLASGECSHAEGVDTTASGDYSHAEGNNTTASGLCSHAEGSGTTASGNNSHAEGIGTTASGLSSHAEGGNTTANGQGSHAEGYKTTAYGYATHAEGEGTTASGSSSHAEGYKTTASGMYCHAEGGNTTASSMYSHAEGRFTKADSMYSHAEGLETLTTTESEHASGRYNISLSGSSTWGDSGNTLFTVGNGISSANTHNALQIMQNGDIYISDTSASGSYFSKPMIKLQDALKNNGGGNGSGSIDTSNFVTTNTTQTITAEKYFDNGINFGNDTSIKSNDSGYLEFHANEGYKFLNELDIYDGAKQVARIGYNGDAQFKDLRISDTINSVNYSKIYNGQGYSNFDGGTYFTEMTFQLQDNHDEAAFVFRNTSGLELARLQSVGTNKFGNIDVNFLTVKRNNLRFEDTYIGQKEIGFNVDGSFYVSSNVIAPDKVNNALTINLLQREITAPEQSIIKIGNSDDMTGNLCIKPATAGGVILAAGTNLGGELYMQGGIVMMRSSDEKTFINMDNGGDIRIEAKNNIYTNKAINNSSDKNLKNIKGDVTLAIEDIANASAIKFTWKDGDNKTVHIGTIAQDWQKILPEAVSEDKDGMLSLDYSGANMVAMISLAKEVVEQKKTISELSDKIARLEEMLEKLMSK